MKNLIKFVAALAAVLSFTACQKEIEGSKEEPVVTHKVTFVAGTPETKTSATVDGSVVNYSWKSTDEQENGTPEKFHVYENGVEATSIEAVLDDDDVMMISAEFAGPEVQNPAYTCHFNSGVRAVQALDSDGEYDQLSDVLVAKENDPEAGDKSMFTFSFRREIAVAEATLKNLAAGEKVSNIRIESTDGTVLAANYDISEKAFSTTGSTSIELNGLALTIDPSERTASFRFITVPVENAMLKVSVTTVDAESKIVGKYVKEFSKAITFNRGNLKIFNVALENDYLDPHINDEGWFRVDDVRALAAGDVIRIGCATATSPSLAGAINGDYLELTTASFNADGTKVLGVTNPVEFTLGVSGSFWTLTSTSGVLGATAAKKLTYDDTKSNYVSDWSISITSAGIATIAPNADGYGAFLCNSTNTPRYLTYASSPNNTGTMTAPSIYKKYGNPTDGKVKSAQNVSFSPNKYTATIGSENDYPELTCQSTGAKTWSSSNEEAATINAETGEITLLAAGVTTISVVVAEDEDYNEGGADYELTVKEAPVVVGTQWVRVTSASELEAGLEVVIASTDADYVMGAAKSSNYSAVATTSVSADKSVITIDSEALQFTLVSGTASNSLAFSYDDAGTTKYLCAASSSSNSLKKQTTLDNNGSWAITYSSDGVAEVVAQGTYTRKYMNYNYNNGNPIFNCYSSNSQTRVAIYKKNDSRSEQTVKFQVNDVDVTSAMNATVGAAFSEPTLVKQSTGAVTYESSNTAVATVNATTGEVTPLKKGPVRITANVEGDDDYRSGSAYYDINVANVLESIALANDSAQPKAFEIGDEFSFAGIKVVATYNDETTAEVSSSDLSFTGFDSSAAAASQEITVSYTENDVTRTTTYNVQIIAAIVRYNINLPEASAGNSISVVGGQTSVQENSEVTLKVNLATGYYLTSLKVNGTEVKESVTDNKYTFTITSDVTVTAGFSNLYVVNFPNSFTNGMAVIVSGVTNGQAAYNSTIEFKVKANDNYEIDSVTAADLSVTKGSVDVDGYTHYTFTMPSEEVTVSVTFKEKDNTIFYESFDNNEGTGGNDGSWSGNIASSTICQDNEGWVYEKGSGAKQCAKFGTGSVLGSATTPALGNACNATLTFKAAAWNGNSESTTLKLSVIDGGSVSPTTVTLVKGAWTDYTVTLSNLTTNSKVKFEGNSASNSRFFLDEVRIVKTGEPTPPTPGTPTQLSVPTGLSWNATTKTLSWSNTNTGNGTYNTDYKYQYRLGSTGSNWVDASSTTTAVLSSLATTTTVYVRAYAINTADYCNSAETANLECTVGAKEQKTIQFTAGQTNTGWTTNGSGTSYLQLTSSSNHITSPSFTCSEIIKVEVTERKYGGPDETQAKTTCEFVPSSGSTSTVGTVTPSSTTLTKYTITPTSTISGTGKIKISNKGASSSKGAGVSVIKIYYYE